MIKRNKLVILCSLGILLASCATTKPDLFRDMELAVSRDDFEGGVEALRTAQESQKPLYPESNAVSMRLDKGLLEHYAGNYNESAEDLMEAERLIEEAFTKSVTEAVASYITNDNSKDYPGEDYEDIYISVFNALNFYHLGNIEDALVEIRKLTYSNGKLDMLSQKYEDSSKSAGSWLLEQLARLGFQLNDALPKGEAVNFSDSALARYLSVLFYIAERNADSARIEHEMLQQSFANNPKIYYHAPPSFIPDMRNVPEGKARLHIIGFAGLSPIKEEGQFEQYFPFFRYAALQRPNFKLPKLVQRGSGGTHNILVSSDGGESTSLELIEDMGAVMTETFGARFGNIFFKTYIRTILKYAAADIGAYAAEQRTNALAAQVIAVAAQKALDATEKADIRMGRFMPDKAYVGYIDLEPGVHNVTVNFDGGVTKVFTDVDVRAGGLNLIQAVSLTGGSQAGGEIRTITASAPVPAAPAPAAAPVQAAAPSQAEDKPELAILHFSGGQGDDGETIAALLSMQNGLRSAFTIVPRTAEVNTIMAGRDFQSSLFINIASAARLGRMLNADYVLAGYIRPVEDRNLVVAYIVDVENSALVGGSYRLYNSIEEIPAILPSMTGNITAAARRNNSGVPGLATASGTEAREPLAQLLLVDLANTGSYVIQGAPTNAANVLSIEAMGLRGRNVMVAELLDAGSKDQLSEGSLNYGTFENGVEQLPNLVAQLLDRFTAPVIAAAPALAAQPAPEPVSPPQGQDDFVQYEQDDYTEYDEASGPARSDAWKNKWLYFGIIWGGGIYNYTNIYYWYESTYPYYHYKEERGSGGFWGPGFSIELALLKFFSIEMGFDLGFEKNDDGLSIYPVAPMLAKLGGRFAQIELTGNVGYTIGLGFAFGTTFGVHLGPGILFFEYTSLPKPKPKDESLDWMHIYMIGYKFGAINKRR